MMVSHTLTIPYDQPSVFHPQQLVLPTPMYSSQPTGTHVYNSFLRCTILKVTLCTTLVWVFKLVLHIAWAISSFTYGNALAFIFDAQSVQRCNMFRFVLLSDTEHFIVA